MGEHGQVRSLTMSDWREFQAQQVAAHPKTRKHCTLCHETRVRAAQEINISHADRKAPYLFISHDLKVVRALSNHVTVIKDGLIVEHGTSDEIFRNPSTDYTRELITAAFSLSATA